MEENRENREITGEIRNEKGQFISGVSGNPNGRPKGSYSIVELIKKKLEEIPEGKDKTYGEYFVEQIMKKTVVEGDVQMMRDVINRVDGMPTQSIDHSNKGEKFDGTINITGLDALAESLEKANKTDYEVNKSTKGLSGVKEDSSLAT